MWGSMCGNRGEAVRPTRAPDSWRGHVCDESDDAEVKVLWWTTSLIRKKWQPPKPPKNRNTTDSSGTRTFVSYIFARNPNSPSAQLFVPRRSTAGEAGGPTWARLCALKQHRRANDNTLAVRLIGRVALFFSVRRLLAHQTCQPRLTKSRPPESICIGCVWWETGVTVQGSQCYCRPARCVVEEESYL